jgi:hypothetical protein
VATIKVSKKRAEPDPPPYLWGFGVFLVGVFIVALLSIDQKPTAQQKQVAEIIVRLLKDPSTTGSGQFAGQ